MEDIDPRIATALSAKYPLGKKIGTIGYRNIFKVAGRQGKIIVAFSEALANGVAEPGAVVALGKLSNQIICNILRLLNEQGVPVAFVVQESLTSFVALACADHALTRMITWRTVNLGALPVVGRVQESASIETAHEIIRKAFLALEETWRSVKYALQYLGVTLGITLRGKLVVVDVCGRLRAPDGKVLRLPSCGDGFQPEDAEALRLIADLTEKFCPQPNAFPTS